MSSATVAVAAAIAPRRASCDASRRERAARVIAGASASDIDRSRESDDDASRGVADDAADDARRRRRRRRDDHPSRSPSRRSLLLGAGALTASAATTTGGVLRPDPARAFIDLPSRLHNRYFLVRHGESTLDTRSLVLSNPSFKYDTTYGLTPRGIEQMHEAARVMIEEHDAAPSWLYTSNFQRSFQSSLILREDFGLLFSQLRTEFSGLLDPRKMGALDGGSEDAHQAVWDGDALDALNTPPPVPASLQPSASVESPRDLFRRALECFTRLESTYFGEDVILVSHQDTLSLFTAALMGTDLRRHHLDYPFALGEVRVVDLTGATSGMVAEGGVAFSPKDLRGEYAVGDRPNYFASGGDE